jgi:C1A family cysteine protease
MDRRIARIILTILILAWGTTLLSADADSAKANSNVSLQNPYVPPGRGFIPPSVGVPNYKASRPASGMPPAALPSRYDCRQYGQVTSVKNQSYCGACYAFASVANAESKILADGGSMYDFSENSAKECSYGSPSCGGGNHIDVANLFSTRGAVLETCDPYAPLDGDCDTGCPAVATLMGMGIISTNAMPDVDLLKSYIYTYGPIYTTLYAGNGDSWYTEMNFYDGSYTLYNPTTTGSNHAVLLIGWDDDLVHAGGTGGWIVKNSWGSTWGGTCGYGTEEGYFTIAYGSASIGTWSSYMTDWQLYDENEVLFYYNEAGWTGQLGYGSVTAWEMCKFTPAETVNINRVEFWTSDVTTDVDVYIYDTFSGSAPSTLLASKLNSSFADPGYHSIPLDSPLEKISGDDFYVVVKITDESYGFPIAYDRNGVIETGKTFYSPTGGSGTWSDAGLAATPKDLTVRARTTAVTCSYQLTAPTSGSDWPISASRTIQWNSSNAGATVKIDLFKGSTYQCTLEASTANDGSYDWTVDYCSGGEAADYRIRVCDEADTTCSDFSDYFTISNPCTIEVTNPTSSDSWPLDSGVTIEWNSTAAGANVGIYLFKGSSKLCDIDTLTANDGSYTWTVDYCAGGTDSDYEIRVVNDADTFCSDLSDYFSITNPCEVAVTNPIGSCDWPVDSSVTIQWNTTAAGSSVRIYLYKSGAELCDIDTLTDNDGSHIWTVTDCGSGAAADYAVKVVDAGDAGCSALSDEFTISIPCSVQAEQPASGSDWSVGTSHTIQWSSSGAASQVKLELFQGDTTLCDIAATTANDGSFDWNVDDCSGGTGSSYRIKITDDTDTSCYDYSDYFTITAPCQVEVTNPIPGDIWYVGSSQSITWRTANVGASVRLQLYKGSDLICDIDTLTDNDGAYDWNVTDCGVGYATDYSIKVSDVTGTACYDFSYQFSIAPYCAIAVLAPVSTDNWVQGEVQTIEWLSNGVGSDVSLELYKDSSLSCLIDSMTANDGSYDWTVADCGGGTSSDYRIKISDRDNPLCFNFSNYFTVTVLPLGVEEDDQPLPAQFALLQNYPNPFNPSTSVGFDLPRSAFVTLEVFNSLGQKVKTLLTAVATAGHHVVTWDATDDEGSRVPSGIYLYRIQAGSFVEIRKMMLLK